ncbi:MAG: hypothetical protein JNM17_39055 [Archangium sp.]|nr:hypothetical protein [Archangium sp.]
MPTPPRGQAKVKSKTTTKVTKETRPKTEYAALRDRFFELSASKQRDAKFLEQVEALETPGIARVDGLPVSAWPTKRFKAVRFFDPDVLDPKLRDVFARPLPHVPHLAAAFIDPADLSFRNFENIVGLDGFFGETKLSLGSRSRFGKKDVYAFSLDASDEVKARLLQLDSLDLYATPLNRGSRGGQRFIFHSAELADALTVAVKQGLQPGGAASTHGLGKSLLGGFVHVNPVFRCNRFEPDDEKFHQHFDTPYFDPARKHVSRWTLLLYLTGGTGEPSLSVEGEEVLGKVAPFTAVVLNQKYAHEGSPYVDGRKVFLRTELIFEETDLEHDPRIAQTFAKAVYLTGESVFAPELERFAEAAYNRAAASHWRAKVPDVKSEPLLHKRFRGLSFVTNGYDWWFPAVMDVKEAAALALVDFFNAEVAGKPFRAQCESKPTTAAPPEVLKNAKPVDAVGTLDKALLFPAPEEPNDACCPFHAPNFDPTRHTEVLDLYCAAQTFARERIFPAPVMVMGEEVLLDPSRFVVEADRVHVLSDKRLAPVNFAACWNYGGSPEAYVGVEARVTTLQPLVPPMLFSREGDTWHLRLDFFRNDWLVKNQVEQVPVPSIGAVDPNDAEEWDWDSEDGEAQQSWLDAAQKVEAKVRKSAPKANTWWGADSPLLRELNSYRRLGQR